MELGSNAVFFHRICPPLLLILVIIIISSKESIAQNGIVVINEFNPEKGCSPYIELKNLGPGRQDIGCYKLVNEKYAITIPPNTVLDPGQIYMIGGTNTIDNCGSIPSVPVDLNWTSCSNCTSVPLTTDAFFAGWENSKSYPLLLYSASNTILDAMRSTANNLATITAPTTNTATSSGAGCSTSTINIPTDISSPSTVYESIGQNLGANATFSRSGDGSCTWYKATSDKRTPGRNNQTESGTATVGATSSYNLTCTTSGTVQPSP